MTEPSQRPSSPPPEKPPAPPAADPTSSSAEDLLAALADDFAARARRGERPMVHEYVAKHPALAERINKIFPAIAAIEESRPPELAAIGEGPGSTIGRYKLLQQIGEGGFGVVFMAEQEHPVRRRVALKIIKLGMDTKQVVARFEAERQALAMMDHPNIAKVLDGGATDTGRPYFVMELVKGIPITEYCDKHNLKITQRLELFSQVCQAVQHAHQKGLIHRDLKPSNVLVNTQDDRPVAKIIDFGIAKATQSRLTEKTLFTEFHQLIGTLEYMSPEQADGSLDVDTRSDVYSLGVLLYELLTGTTPFDPRELRRMAYAEMQRVIREVEPPRPSTRLSTMKHTLPSVAAHRAIEPRKLDTLVRGELDWIVMKCLEKDRARRYETASGLAMDLHRYLDDESVLACPASATYRFQKMVRRNKLAFAATAAVVLALVIGLTLATTGFVQASRERAIAEAHSSRADREARNARREADKQKAVNRFLNEMFGSADPYRLSATDTVKGKNVTVLEVLDVAGTALDSGSMKDQPEIDAAVRMTLGNTYWHLGRNDAAEKHLRLALKLNKQVYGPDDPVVAETLSALGRVIGPRVRNPENDELYEAATEMQQRLMGGGGDPDATQSLNDLASFLQKRQTSAEAQSLYRDVLRIQRKTHGPEHVEVAVAMVALANSLRGPGPMESNQLYREALAMQRRLLGPDDPQVAATLMNMASFLRSRDPSEAEALCREALEIRQRQLTDQHPDVAETFDLLASFLEQRQEYAKAEPLRRRALEIVYKTFGDHLRVYNSVASLVGCLHAQGRFAEAEQMYRQRQEIIRAAEGVSVTSLASNLGLIAQELRLQGKPSEAEQLLRDELTRFREAMGEHENVASLLYELASELQTQNKLAEAERSFREALEMRRRLYPDGYGLISPSMTSLASVLRVQKKFPEAEQVYIENLAIAQKQSGSAHARVASALRMLAAELRIQQRLPEAEVRYREELDMQRSLSLPEDDYAITTCINGLAGVLRAQGKPDQAEQVFREHVRRLRTKYGDRDLRVASALTSMGTEMRSQGRLADAEQFNREAMAIRQKLLGEENADVAWNLAEIAWLLQLQGNLADAEPMLRRALAMRQKVLGEVSAFVAMNLSDLSWILQRQGKLTEAEQCARQSLAMRQKVVGIGHADWALSVVRLTEVLEQQQKFDEAEELNRDAVVTRQKLLGEGNAAAAQSLFDLACLIQRRGKLDQAEQLFRQAVASWKEAQGPESASVSLGLSQLAWVLQHQGKSGEAEQLARQSLAMAQTLLGDGNVEVGWRLYDLAGILQRQGKNLPEAEQSARQAVDIWRRTSDPEYPNMALGLACLSSVLQAEGKLTEAEASYREALAIRRSALGNEHSDVAQSLIHLAWVLEDEGKLTEAESAVREASAINRKAFGNEHPEVVANLLSIAYLLHAQDKLAEAEPLYREALTVRRKAAEQRPNDAVALNRLAWVLATCAVEELRDPTQAVGLAKKAVQLSPTTGYIRNTLGVARYRAGEFKQAVADLEASMQRSNGGNGDDFFFLAMTHWRLGNEEEARRWYDRAVEWMQINRNNWDAPVFRAEAAQLLGIPQAQPAAPPAASTSQNQKN